MICNSEEGDVLSIPKQLETVNISGQVLRSTSVRYQGKSLGYYIASAGGFGAKALAGRTYVVYPNGSVDATSHFLGFRPPQGKTGGQHRGAIEAGKERHERGRNDRYYIQHCLYGSTDCYAIQVI